MRIDSGTNPNIELRLAGRRNASLRKRVSKDHNGRVIMKRRKKDKIANEHE